MTKNARQLRRAELLRIKKNGIQLTELKKVFKLINQVKIDSQYAKECAKVK